MILHVELGDDAFNRKRALVSLRARGEITLAGYCKEKIYGTLSCKSGKRMKAVNRIFFKDKQEAQAAGYRPCGSCMPHEYALWKKEL